MGTKSLATGLGPDAGPALREASDKPSAGTTTGCHGLTLRAARIDLPFRSTGSEGRNRRGGRSASANLCLPERGDRQALVERPPPLRFCEGNRNGGDHHHPRREKIARGNEGVCLGVSIPHRHSGESRNPFRDRCRGGNLTEWTPTGVYPSDSIGGRGNDGWGSAVGWAKRRSRVPTRAPASSAWARRKRGFAHPTRHPRRLAPWITAADVDNELAPGLSPKPRSGRRP
jgi:hypothetical protein